MSLRVAIMQPYFFPYAGYFSLFAAVDLFVVLDCVQFPRRGYVHRNQIGDGNNTPQWLTLPLLKADRDTTRICDLQFAPLARELMLQQFRRFPCLIKLDQTAPDLCRSILDFERSPVTYLVENLRYVIRLLGIERPMVRSSSLNIPPDLKSQERIIEIARLVKARHYVNASGGRAIYEAQAFANAGISLHFLSDHQGSFKSILERVLTEEIVSIVGELQRDLDIEFQSI
jgi:hypothetical protein